MLYGATFVVNLLGLVLALWLSLFLISRNPRYPVAWLTAVMLWLMAAMFMNVLLAINPPPVVALKLSWARYLFPFWPRETLTGNPNNWLQGWSVTPALALWHHVSILLLPGRTNVWRWTRILLGYLLAAIAILLQADAQILFSAQTSDPLYLNSLQAGPWYPFFGATLVILTWTCVFNLWRAARVASSKMARQQLLILAWAALCAGLVGPVSIAASYFRVPIPMLVISILEAAPVGLIGWAVVRYSALMHGRTSQRDFIYHLVLLGLVLLVYVPFSWLLQKLYAAPLVIIIFFPALAVLTHASITAVFRLMDWMFYRQETRQLRHGLRQLSRQVGANETLEELLDHPLQTLCRMVQAAYGLVLVFEGPAARRVAAYHLDEALPELVPQAMAADDAIHLSPGHLPPPLAEAALLVPLYGESEQLGTLLLGRPKNGLLYAEEDIEKILAFTDRMGETMLVAQRNAQYLAQIAMLVQAQQPPVSGDIPLVSAEDLESALRSLYDYSSLADNPLAALHLVQTRLAQGEITHLERGKVVHAILLEALEKLRPQQAAPSNPPSRAWYPYLILQEAYLNETSNRDIMLKLYISEGTFNRTRRAAIRSLARALGEMEALMPRF